MSKGDGPADEEESLLITLQGYKLHGLPLSVKKAYSMMTPPDMVINLGSSSRRIYCHKRVLSVRSPVLKRMIALRSPKDEQILNRSSSSSSSESTISDMVIDQQSSGSHSDTEILAEMVVSTNSGKEILRRPSPPERKTRNPEPNLVIWIETPHPVGVQFMIELFYSGSVSFPLSIAHGLKNGIVKTLDTYHVQYKMDYVPLRQPDVDDGGNYDEDKWHSVSDVEYEADESGHEFKSSGNRAAKSQSKAKKSSKTPGNRSRKTDNGASGINHGNRDDEWEMVQRRRMVSGETSHRSELHLTPANIRMADIMDCSHPSCGKMDTQQAVIIKEKAIRSGKSDSRPVTDVAIKDEPVTPNQQPCRSNVSRKASKGRRRVMFSPDGDSNEENKDRNRPIWKCSRSPTPFRGERQKREEEEEGGKKRKRSGSARECSGSDEAEETLQQDGEESGKNEEHRNRREREGNVEGRTPKKKLKLDMLTPRSRFSHRILKLAVSKKRTP